MLSWVYDRAVGMKSWESQGSHAAGVYMSMMQNGVTKVKTIGYIAPEPRGHMDF